MLTHKRLNLKINKCKGIQKKKTKKKKKMSRKRNNNGRLDLFKDSNTYVFNLLVEFEFFST